VAQHDSAMLAMMHYLMQQNQALLQSPPGSPTNSQTVNVKVINSPPVARKSPSPRPKTTTTKKKA
jgi:hypothetical protein